MKLKRHVVQILVERIVSLIFFFIGPGFRFMEFRKKCLNNAVKVSGVFR